MKKIIIICLTLGLITGGVFGEDKKDPIASITTSFGEVYIKHNNQKDWEITKVGMYVYEGDRMRTKDTGKAEVMFINGSIVFLGNDTEMEFLNEDDKEDDTNSLFLFFGTIWNKVTEGSNYNVESVHALATVRGTEFWLKNTKKLLVVTVKSGSVSIKNKYGEVEAEENTKVRVSEKVAPIKEETDSFPEDITFDSDIVIETNVPTQIYKGDWYKVSGIVRNKDQSTAYTETLEIKVVGSNNLFLKKNKQDKKGEKSLTLNSERGMFNFLIYSQGDSESFTLSSRKTNSETQYIESSKSILKDHVVVKYYNEDRTIKYIKATFEKQ
ncbi:hypothetical protein DID74_00515 [Candidatus Marinamargulisbacteria bacterium SCGC AG-333-B06]|nr:hypothetical protein DID74_00515 [Candidatus Marinamargulisbacteria bacterium SCGC AG-333-B06]